MPASDRRVWIVSLSIAVVALVVAVAASIGFLRWSGDPPVPAASSAVTTAARPDFAGSTSCRECHRAEYDAWTGSHHDRAMDHATPDTVLGDFNDAAYTHHTVTSTFFRRDGRYYVRTDGPDGQLTEYPIAFTFGVTPLQQYLIEMPGGRLQALGIAWDSRPAEQGGQRWFHLQPDHPTPHTDVLHWTGRAQNWNAMCASCHSTHVRKNYDPATDTYNTLYAEIDVSCEACHGPGSAHVAWAADPDPAAVNFGLTTSLASAFPIGTPTTDRSAPPADRQLDSCFLCHARRNIVAEGYVHGDPPLDHFTPALLHEGLYHADGQILEEVYEYGSLTQSKMYLKGVACSDCHDPHSLQLAAPGNALCIRCHRPDQYDAVAHHHHDPGTSGSLCVDCHMPVKTYMVIDDRRDHSLRVPRPDLSVSLGTPNACTACHADKPAQWAAAAVVEWFGPTRPDDPHFAPMFAAARRADPAALPGLIELARDPARPAVVRATAVSMLANYRPDLTESALTATLADPHPLVRTAAAFAMAVAPRPALIDLLDDPVRSVRTEAARALTTFPVDLTRPGVVSGMNVSEQLAAAFNAAIDEYLAGQRTLTDLPAAHMNIGGTYVNLGRPEDAAVEFRQALAKAPYFNPARLALATLQAQAGRSDVAESLLREALTQTEDPQLYLAHFRLGLLIAESPARLDEAIDHLALAAELAPDAARIHYNLGLARQQAGRPAEAERALLRAYQLDTQSVDTIHALALLYEQEGQLERALAFAQRLAQLLPADPAPAQLLQRLRARQSNP